MSDALWSHKYSRRLSTPDAESADGVEPGRRPRFCRSLHRSCVSVLPYPEGTSGTPKQDGRATRSSGAETQADKVPVYSQRS